MMETSGLRRELVLGACHDQGQEISIPGKGLASFREGLMGPEQRHLLTSRVTRLALLVSIVVMAFGPLTALVPSAQAQSASVDVAPGSARAGTPLAITGAGFAPETEGQIVWAADGTTLATVMTDPAGSFSVEIITPEFEPATYELQVVIGDTQAGTSLTVLGQPQLSLIPESAAPGTAVRAQGFNFTPNTSGQLLWGADGSWLADFSTDGAGAFTAQWTTPQVEPGAYPVIAVAGDTQVEATLSVPRLVADPSTAQGGQPVLLHGQGLPTEAAGEVLWQDGTLLATFFTSWDGAATVEFVAPGVAPGEYTVRASVDNILNDGTMIEDTVVETTVVLTEPPTPEPTATPEPTLAPEPTATPEPSPTLEPTATTQPTLEPTTTMESAAVADASPETSEAGPAVAAAAPLAADGIAFSPVADTSVRQDTPDTAYGDSTTLRVDAGDGVEARTYLRFDVAGLTGNVQQATLRLAVRSGSTNGPGVCATGNDWDEAGLTWNTRPGRTSDVVDNKGVLVTGEWAEYDVTQFVTGNGTISLCLEADSTDGIDFYSRQTSDAALHPQLVISTGDAAPSPSGTPTPTAAATPPASGAIPGESLSLPLRAAFYYPWFPGAWSQQGVNPYTNFTPSKGFYDGGDSTVVSNHIAEMQYGNIQVGIASWWGQGTREDQRMPQLLAAASGTGFKWATYYEDEGFGNPSVETLQADLAYLRERYAADPSYLRIDGKFVVFVYGSAESCEMVDRWTQANTVDAYIVLKVFSGYRECAAQPDSWHQYAPAKAADAQGAHSYTISPGFHLYGEQVRLERDLTRWQQNVQAMVASGADWQLVTTFNEWGEGTSVESAEEWSSDSGFGQYLDVLHANGGGTVEGSPTGTPSATAPPVVSGDGPVLVGAGDVSTCRNDGDEATAKLLDGIAGTVITLGDNVYDNGTSAEFANCYDPTWGRHKSRTRPSPGNHDYNTSGAAGYYGYFGAAAGQPGSGYYSYDVNGWHVVALNSNIDMSAGSAQEQWLRADLAANPTACTVAYLHHPRYSSSTSHGGSTSVTPLWQALYDAGAEVVLAGHDHTYERFAPMDPHGNIDTSFGMRSFVVGTGGRNHYGMGERTPGSEVAHTGTLGVIKLTLEPGSYSWEFVPAAGGTFSDAGSGTCHGAPGDGATAPLPDPEAPSTPTPTPVAGAPGSNPSFNGSMLPIAVGTSSVASTSPTRAFDGSLNSNWYTTGSAPSSAAFTLDLGQIQPLTGVKWTYGSADGMDTMRLEVSANGTSWTHLSTTTVRQPLTWEGSATTAQARYVRLTFTNTSNRPYLGIVAEVQVWGTAAPTAAINPTFPGASLPITGSSSSVPSTSPARAHDGSLGSNWYTTGATPSSAALTLDLGTSQSLTGVKWSFGTIEGADRMHVEVSATGTAWTRLLTTPAQQPLRWEGVATTAQARYVRLVFDNPSNRPHIGIVAEVQVWGKATSTPAPEPGSAGSNPAFSGSALPIATGSSSVSSTSPTRAFDGSTGSNWYTTAARPSSAALTLDLGRIQQLSGVKWTYGSPDGVDQMRLEVSANGTSWTHVSTTTLRQPLTWEGSATTAQARYVRMIFNNTSNRPYLGIVAEVQVWGTSASAHLSDAETLEAGAITPFLRDGNASQAWLTGRTTRRYHSGLRRRGPASRR